MASSRVNPGDVLAGKYRVERVLGEGGMGVVVAAFHLALEQTVAVKFLRRDMVDRGDAAERFRREARAVAKINSEHVARVLDVGTMDDGETYIVMEYLDGNDLSAEMHNRGALPVPEAVDIALQVADAVSDAHAAGIVHRDLKPANVFLVRRPDGSRLVKVLDFGISKSLLADSASHVSLTQTSTVMGSPLYMSPEQMRSARDVDTRTDIWSLGVILYEALAGSPPHGGTSLPEICTSLLHDTPRPLESVRGDLPHGLTAVIMRCLAKDRNERWPTVRDFINALLPYAAVGPSLVSAMIGQGALARSSLPPTPGGTGPGTGPSRPGLSGSDPSVPRISGVARSVQVENSTQAPASLTLSSSPADVRAARRARNAIFIGLAGAAMLVSTIAFFLLRLGGSGDEPSKRPDVAHVDPPKPAAQANAAAAVVVQPTAAPGPSSSAETEAPAVSVATRGAGGESVLPHSSAAGPVKEPHVPRVTEHAWPKRPATAEAITDFGGRR